MRDCYIPTGSASLNAHTQELEQRLRTIQGSVAQLPASAANHNAWLDDDTQACKRMQLLLTNTEAAFETRAARGLQFVLEHTGAQTGFVFMRQAPDQQVHSGAQAPTPALLRWARAQLDIVALEQTVLTSGDRDQAFEDSERTIDDVWYCVSPLYGSATDDSPSAGLVLGFQGIEPRRARPELLSLLAEQLQTVQSAAES
jgi:hypothetical protein